jgi:hypothetical protein
LNDFPPDRCKPLADRSLAEKPKVGELQMDWLRSEDLKEEKNVTTPMAIIAGRGDPLIVHFAGSVTGQRITAD